MCDPSFIPYGKQQIDELDLEVVRETLQSDFLTSGPRVEEFEREFANLVGAKHAVAVSSATAALHIAMLAAEVQPLDRVVTSPNTFVSSANCAAFVGAIPDFCDIDASYNLCPISLEKNWKEDTKVVVAVAFAGQSSDMAAIHQVATSRGALVVEDASHGAGGGFFHEGIPYKLGGHPWADMTIFSFHPVKTMTTGEGGMLVTDDDDLAERARRARSHGVVRDPSLFEGLGSDEGSLAERGSWYYEMQSLGYNYRISDIQCALGLSQLRKLPSFIRRRQEIVARYNEAFEGSELLMIPHLRERGDQEEVSWHLYSVLIDFACLGKTRTTVMAELREKKVGSQVHYIPVYLQPWYRHTYQYAPGKCPEAETYYAKTLSLPLYSAMSDEDVARVIAAVKEVLTV